jgi:uncharacterized protein YkwD
MKKIIFFLCLFLLVSFKSPNNNDVSIIVHFEKILNEYRYSNGLNPVKIDHSMKEFTDLRSKSLVTDYSHNGFKENIKSFNFNGKSGGENIAMVRNVSNNNKPYWSSNIKEIGDILNKMAMGTSTNYDVALYCFLKWKHSPSHNDLLLNPKIKKFHLSYEKSETFYYFCFIGFD